MKRMFLMLIVLLLVSVSLVSEALAAADTTDAASPALSRVMTHVIELLAALMIALITVLTAKVSSYFTKKTKIEVPAKTEAMVAEWGAKAVHYATEKAHQYAKEKGESMKGPDKLEVALNFGISLAEEYKLPHLAKDKLTKYIEAKLGETRTPNLIVGTEVESR